MEKTFNRIIFRNDAEPAINEANLNEITRAIDVIDTRVATLAGADDVLAKADELKQTAQRAEAAAAKAEAASGVSIATPTRAGLVKPDGTTLLLGGDGTLKADVNNEDPISTGGGQTTIRIFSSGGSRQYSIDLDSMLKPPANTVSGKGVYSRTLLYSVIDRLTSSIHNNTRKLIALVAQIATDVIKVSGDLWVVASGTLQGGDANEAKNTAVIVNLDLDSNYVFTYDSWLVANNNYRGQESFMISTVHTGTTASNTNLAVVHRFSAAGTTGITYALNRHKIGDMYYPSFGFGTCGTGAAVKYKLTKIL